MHAPKLIWLARHRPETIAKAGHFFDLTDFLSFRASRVVCPLVLPGDLQVRLSRA